MNKRVLLHLLLAATVLTGCSNLVTVDRSKIDDDLYQPTDSGAADAGADSGSDAALPDAAANGDAGDDDAGSSDAA